MVMKPISLLRGQTGMIIVVLTIQTNACDLRNMAIMMLLASTWFLMVAFIAGLSSDSFRVLNYSIGLE